MIELPEPKAGVLARRDEIVAAICKRLLPDSGVISEALRLKPYETDGLAAYRQPPMVVVLPETTEQVAAVLAYCHRNGIPVVPRGAGTSLSGGALPTADCVVIGMMRMSRILEIDYADRFAVVQAGRHQPQHHQCRAGAGLLLRARSVEPARLHDRRQRQHELGRRPLPEIRRHRQQPAGPEDRHRSTGEIIEIGGTHLDAAGYDWLGLLTGSEGQLAVVTEVTVRILRGPEGARAMLAAFRSNEIAGACVDAIIGSGIIPVALEFMDRPAIHACEAFAHAGYPARCRGDADHRGRGQRRRAG